MDETLQHHGVKGMKWGVRKDRKHGSGRDTPNKNYSAAMRKSDSVYGENNVKRINRKMNEGKSHKRAEREVLYGKRGANRIEKRMAKGQKASTAENKEALIQVGKGLAISTAMYAGMYACSRAYSNYATSPSYRKNVNKKANDAGKWVQEHSRSSRYLIQDFLHGAHIIDRGDKVSVTDIPIDIMTSIVKR